MVLVGNKSDLSDKREVSNAQGQQLAEKFGCRYYETSVVWLWHCDTLMG
jgi:hypothetical protein